jgi:adenosylmethionine-8-amino-7-oxononanoate aminotransferase
VGKGISGGYFPLSATLFNEKVSNVIRPRVLMHGFSYSFPMAGILSTIEYLKVLENEQIFSHYSTVIDSMNNVAEELFNRDLIAGYRHYGVCYNLILNKPFYELWRKDDHFYKHGLHMGLWNNYSDGVLVMVPLNATPEYFFQLKAKLFGCLSTLYET